jgi:hypothetical protein
VPLNIIQRQLGHVNLGTTSIYLQGDRHRGDHRRRELTASTDDARQRRSTALKTPSCERELMGAPAPLCQTNNAQSVAESASARPMHASRFGPMTCLLLVVVVA